MPPRSWPRRPGGSSAANGWPQHQPVAQNDLDADNELFESLLAKAQAAGVSVVTKQFQEQVKTEFFQQAGVTLTVKGDLSNVFRWIYSVLSPGDFRVVPYLKITPDKDDAAKVVCAVQFWRWYQPPSAKPILMKKLSAILLALSAAHGAFSSAPFIEPQPHPISRYEAGWEKNPFTLKTAPVAVQKESFAKDLALAGGIVMGEDTTVRLVNTKTREITRLKNHEPGPDGLKVKTAHLEDRRADTFVELERNGETAIVRYDESYQRQMAAQQGAGASPNPQGAAPRVPTLPGQGVPPGLGTNAPPGMQPQPVSAARPTVAPNVPNPQLPQSVASPANSAPTIQRRRLNTLPQPIQR